ncbi:MAG TPA: hypothetical protein VHZ55_10310 [Bryobacteraceae bacterium]|nr:hypothetical protein [Bryobacteraceae bacterium]
MKRFFLCVTVTIALFSRTSQATTFQAAGADEKAWRAILGAVGITEDAKRPPEILVVGAGAKPELVAQAEGKILILEGASAAAEKAGFVSESRTLSVRQICDTHAPNMQIFWEKPVSMVPSIVPADYQVFAKERWSGTPLLAGKRTAHGAILWLAVPPGETGIERFPYLLQALTDLGWSAPAQTTTLWAFFDSSYRIRADPEYLAERWRRTGVGVLHVAAWHNMESDAAQDDYLTRLIAACHRNAISVYAWLELPHVSEKFWADNPQWREKTAVGQDAQLDWRKLMNLQNPECRLAIAREIQILLGRFDWDGVNLAELYFESLEGAANPARFTPLNDDVRADFQKQAGFDPKLLFDGSSQYSASKNSAALRNFLDYRAGLAARMQREWLGTMDEARKSKPYLDVVLTHIDDRFDAGIRDELGADVARSLPLIAARRDTLLVEDPATLWALGPDRYARLADKYKQLSKDEKQFAVDINVVERYQDVYPTKKQTGVELFALLHQASVSFGRVALYFENSLEKQDLALLPAAATTARVEQIAPDELTVDAPDVTRIPWQGPVEVDGRVWPIQDQDSVLAPEGKHRLSAAVERPSITLRDFNGAVSSATFNTRQVDVAYQSKTRAIAVLSTPSEGVSVEVDGEKFPRGGGDFILLPAGQHVVSFFR